MRQIPCYSVKSDCVDFFESGILPLNGVGEGLTHRVTIANSGSEPAEVLVRGLGGGEAASGAAAAGAAAAAGEESAAAKFCHQCGGALPEGARFCPSCGTKLEG